MNANLVSWIGAGKVSALPDDPIAWYPLDVKSRPEFVIRDQFAAEDPDRGGRPAGAVSGPFLFPCLLLTEGEASDIFPLRKGRLSGSDQAWTVARRGSALVVEGEKQRFVVNIEILGLSVGVSIHADDVEAA